MDSGDELGLPKDPRGIRARLEQMRDEHRSLDDSIVAMHESGNVDTLQLARLKKRKLALKDEITWLEDQNTPDIIA